MITKDMQDEIVKNTEKTVNREFKLLLRTAAVARYLFGVVNLVGVYFLYEILNLLQGAM